MIIRSLIFVLLSIYSLNAAQARYWKYNDQQGNVGACHSFTTVALIEAEYKIATGKFINLSERELFIRHFTKSAKSPSHCIIRQLHAATNSRLPDHYQESGHITDDFQLAMEYGIASERESPYAPMFSNGIDISLSILRHQRNLLSTEVALLKSSQLWNLEKRKELIQHYSQRLAGVSKTFTIPVRSKTRSKTKKFLRQYSLKQFSPKTTRNAKSHIITKLSTRPVAVDVTNLNEISGRAPTIHSRHSLVISHYHPKTDQFTIRSSTFKGLKKVSANTLARGCYQIYHLHKN